MKKAYLMTLYLANNIGAYLQAFSTMEILRKYGLDVYFIRFETNIENKSKFEKIKKYLREFEIKKLFFKYLSTKKYNECQRIFKTKEINECLADDDGIFILGSDECLNIESKSFSHHKEYLGIGMENKRLFAFASSANNCKIDSFKKKNISSFNNFKAFSVRDLNTYNIVHEFYNKEIIKLFDPTLLLSDLGKYKKRVCKYDRFILLYSYGLTKNQIKEVTDFSKIMKMKIISVGTYNKCASRNIVVDPFEFLDYLESAQYVITSTFHGTILSIKFNKKVYIYSNNNQKIVDAIKEFSFGKHSDIDKNLLDSFNVEFNYVYINEVIKENVSLANDYLLENIGELK